MNRPGSLASPVLAGVCVLSIVAAVVAYETRVEVAAHDSTRRAIDAQDMGQVSVVTVPSVYQHSIEVDVDPVLVESDKYIAIATLAGSLTDFVGRETTQLGEGVWFVESDSWHAIVLAEGDGLLTSYRSDRSTPSRIRFDAGDMQRFMSMAVIDESGQDVVVPVDCDENEFVCQCRITAAQSCQGIAMNAWKCCPEGTFCGCQVATPPDDDCVVGVAAGCIGGGGDIGNE